MKWQDLSFRYRTVEMTLIGYVGAQLLLTSDLNQQHDTFKDLGGSYFGPVVIVGYLIGVGFDIINHFSRKSVDDGVRSSRLESTIEDTSFNNSAE